MRTSQSEWRAQGLCSQDTSANLEKKFQKPHALVPTARENKQSTAALTWVHWDNGLFERRAKGWKQGEDLETVELASLARVWWPSELSRSQSLRTNLRGCLVFTCSKPGLMYLLRTHYELPAGGHSL
ncbi:uncharacterized protein LOC144240152 [Crocuta crocuta]